MRQLLTLFVSENFTLVVYGICVASVNCYNVMLRAKYVIYQNNCWITAVFTRFVRKSRSHALAFVAI